MRFSETLHDGWLFTKEAVDGVPAYAPGPEWEAVEVPHTWNAFDGQDGGSDYYRGACWYVRQLTLKPHAPETRVYLEFQGAANVAEVYVNGCKITEHVGGYSTFRADITTALMPGENVLAVKVSNEERTDVYPQMADFTFYGGLYRPVDVLYVNPTHFELDYHGGDGVTVSSTIDDGTAVLDARAWVTEPAEGDVVNFQIFDDDGNEVASAAVPADLGDGNVRTEIVIPDAHLWQGVEDPYLYDVVATIIRHNEVLDEVSFLHGVREFRFDPQEGFFLNGKLTPLRGVSRHQDRLGKGNALSLEDHVEDAYLIKELGANTIRLAHYQQSRDFYDLCDQLGFVIWAEIPFISRMSDDPAAHQDCLSQMTELVIQNFNHASILMWGISNEILIGGDSPKLVENLKEINDLAHSLDPTRVTTMAQVSSTPKDSEHNQITDILSYNHYFGWYGGHFEDNEAWLDDFHAMHPDRSFGLSEYGCEGIISYHTDDPQCGDYSEEYQALYHEHMARIIDERPWLWGTHVWNMFDFGCDARKEGGVEGRNNKGLVTIDRKIKKDSFFIYQAYWSAEPMVHICSKRYARRAADTIDVKVYSNQDEVALAVDGKPFATLAASAQNDPHIFIFKDVPLADGYTHVTVRAGIVEDSATWQKVAEPYEPYKFVDPEGGNIVMNWFDDVSADDGLPVDAPYDEAYYSVHDTVSAILDNPEASATVTNAASSLANMRIKASMLGVLGNKSLVEMFDQLRNMSGGASDIPQKLAYLNKQLQQIKK
ncbi:glycoside hydrolase family 2 protein [Bifidobacterium tissieri]|uniref:Beta-galactosidase n=1 Tax=Bifidobacterium tissieri TaxID=1630162 RepID=A0A5N0A083_9BIFI|nr:glycoside hydrolase family 2 TIM barrel-domain containing protein [Bifidobacterium tissieri]KAA8831156.1 beta-galactosidase [Bifidobacterium tissieri]KAA8833188.1 beta-galactosidase [Bifidobacterium tissieri]